MDKLEDIAKNTKENQNLKSLAYKFLDYNIRIESIGMFDWSSRISKTNRYSLYRKAREVFYTILKKEKKRIMAYLTLGERANFISLLNKKRYILNDFEINAISSSFDKDSAYSFLLGYGLSLSKDKGCFKEARIAGEKALDLARKNGDLECYGKKRNVLKIKNPFSEKTIIFKKSSKQDAEELCLENRVWAYYQCHQYPPGKLSVSKDKNKPIFNLPKKIAYFPCISEEGAMYIVWKADSKDLLNTILKSYNKTKKKLVERYLKEVANLNAFGPFWFVPKQQYLITKSSFQKRMEDVVNERVTPSLTKEIINNYVVIAKNLSESKVKGIVKDATLKNAVYANKKVISLDFDRMRIAPLQMDISKLLVLSYGDRKEFLKKYIKEYNSAANFFNKHFANKIFYFPHYKRENEPERQKIIDKNEFYFVYLNSVIDHALHFLLEDKHQEEFEKLDIKSIQIDNALCAIKELQTKYRNRYPPKEIKKLKTLSELFKHNFTPSITIRK